MKEAFDSVFIKLFPFRNLARDEAKAILSSINYTISKFEKGKIIFDKEHYEKKIGFVLSGICEVERPRSSATALPLNSIGKYGSFGILSVFHQGSEYPTRIKAKCKAEIMFIPSEDIISLVRSNFTVAENVISFLAEKIAFLNGKIATFSAKSNESRVAGFLLSENKKEGESIDVSLAKMSRELNVGRATLYRILSAFENEGYIKTETKKIIFINPRGLERM